MPHIQGMNDIDVEGVMLNGNNCDSFDWVGAINLSKKYIYKLIGFVLNM